MLYPCFSVPKEEWGEAVLMPPPHCRHLGLPSLAIAVKAILPLPPQPPRDKSHGCGDGKEGAKLYL